MGFSVLKMDISLRLKRNEKSQKNMSPALIMNQTAKKMISSMREDRYMHGVKRELRRWK